MNYNNNIPPQHSTPMAPSDREGRFTENAWVYPPGQQAIQGNSASPHSPASGPAQNDTDSYILNAPKYISSTPVTGMSGSAAPRDVGPPSTLVATTPYQIGTGHGDLCSIPYGLSSSAQSDLGLESPLALPAHRHQPSSEWNPLLNVSRGEIQLYLENTRRFPMQPHHAQPSDNMTYDPQRPALVYTPHREYPDQGARPSAEAAPRARPSPGSAPAGLCGTERQLIQHNHSGPNHQPTKDSFNLAPANHQQPRPRPTIDGRYSASHLTIPKPSSPSLVGIRSHNLRQRYARSVEPDFPVIIVNVTGLDTRRNTSVATSRVGTARVHFVDQTHC